MGPCTGYTNASRKHLEAELVGQGLCVCVCAYMVPELLDLPEQISTTTSRSIAVLHFEHMGKLKGQCHQLDGLDL